MPWPEPPRPSTLSIITLDKQDGYSAGDAERRGRCARAGTPRNRPRTPPARALKGSRYCADPPRTARGSATLPGGKFGVPARACRSARGSCAGRRGCRPGTSRPDRHGSRRTTGCEWPQGRNSRRTFTQITPGRNWSSPATRSASRRPAIGSGQPALCTTTWRSSIKRHADWRPSRTPASVHRGSVYSPSSSCCARQQRSPSPTAAEWTRCSRRCS